MNTENNTNLSPTRMVNIKKLVPGTLILVLQDAANSINERNIIIDAHRDLYRVPLNIAASMFQIEGTFSLYKQGLFTFNTKEEKEAVFSYAKELQIYFEDEYSNQGNVAIKYEQPAELLSSAEITNSLTQGRKKAIQSILDSKNEGQIALLVDAAIKLGGSISLDIKEMIEKATGVGFPEGEE